MLYIPDFVLEFIDTNNCLFPLQIANNILVLVIFKLTNVTAYFLLQLTVNALF
jgi:hypothetical protein